MQARGIKHDAEKVRLDLLPPSALVGIARVFTFGAAKYDPWNWRKGIEFSRLFAALQRHLLAWQSGEDIDPESGMPHLAHAGCTLLMLLELSADPQAADLDDRCPDLTKL